MSLNSMFANSSAYDFFNTYSNLVKVRNEFGSGDKFRNFAHALGYKVSEINNFLDHGPFKCFDLAMDKWLNKSPKMSDFVQILLKVKHKSLSRQLGLDVQELYAILEAQPETLDILNQSNMICDTYETSTSNSKANATIFDSFQTSSLAKPDMLIDKFNATTIVPTMRDFVNGPRNGWLIDICSTMDKSKTWKDLLKNLGLYTDAHIVDFSDKLEASYNKNRSEITLPLLQKLAQSKLGDKTLDEFTQILLELKSDSVQQAVREWAISRAKQEQENEFVNENTVLLHTHITKFLTENKLANENDIPNIARKLIDFGIDDFDNMKELRESDFTDAGLTRIKARKAADLVKTKEIK